MKKRTTTKHLNTTITNNLLHITKAEIYNKTTRKTDVINTDAFQKSLGFLCETIFADCIGWYFERDYKTGDYVTECSRKDGSVDLIIIAHLCACDGVDRECIDNVLSVSEEE